MLPEKSNSIFEKFFIDLSYLVSEKPESKRHENNRCQTFTRNPENDTNDKCDQ